MTVSPVIGGYADACMSARYSKHVEWQSLLIGKADQMANSKVNQCISNIHHVLLLSLIRCTTKSVRSADAHTRPQFWNLCLSSGLPKAGIVRFLWTNTLLNCNCPELCYQLTYPWMDLIFLSCWGWELNRHRRDIKFVCDKSTFCLEMMLGRAMFLS